MFLLNTVTPNLNTLGCCAQNTNTEDDQSISMHHCEVTLISLDFRSFLSNYISTRKHSSVETQPVLLNWVCQKSQ